jgi:two-component system, OmpR family, sensor histidine kinase VicK
LKLSDDSALISRDNRRGPTGTTVVSGVDEVSKLGFHIASSVKNRLCVYADKNTPALNFRIESYNQSYEQMKQRGVKVQFVTEITTENVDYCKRMMSDLGIELRHCNDSIKGCFSIADGREFMSSSGIPSDGPIDEVLYSDQPNLVQQYQLLFNSQWTRAIPAHDVMRSIESGREGNLTEFILDREPAVQKVLQILRNARSEVNGIGNESAPNLIMAFEPYKNAVRDCAKRVQRGRYITNITHSNVQACKTLLDQFGIEVRHLAGLSTNVIFSESEFSSDLAAPHPDSPTTRLLYSNVPELVIQQKQLFDALWSTAKSGSERIREIEEGAEPEETKILTDYAEVTSQAQDLGQRVHSEALILLPTPVRLLTTPQVFNIFGEKALVDKVSVRLLTPLKGDLQKAPDYISKKFPMFQIRNVSPIGIGLIIADRRRMLIVEYADVANPDLSRAIISGIFSTHKDTIASIASIFETLWKESELREDEAKIRRQSELLQDILTHDIRNYNQVAKMSAELIKEESSGNEQIDSLAGTLLAAIDGSSELVERAKKLGRIITQGKISLQKVDLIKTIESSLKLVRSAYPEKKLLSDVQFESEGRAFVAADDLLHEAFDNIFSNAVKYTDGDEAKIEVKISRSENLWKVEISDSARGMSDETKSNAFTRYLSTAKGSGLGLSIVYAIIVERYGREVRIRNKNPDDYSKGTTVELLLQAV